MNDAFTNAVVMAQDLADSAMDRAGDDLDKARALVLDDLILVASRLAELFGDESSRQLLQDALKLVDEDLDS